MRKLVAEFIGTLWLVLGGCGSAVLAAGYPELGIGFVGVAIAFGRSIKENSLTVVKGIGPKIQSLFYKNNIRSWSALADCNIGRCQEILDAGGNSFSMHDPATWPEQARLAAEGEWKELHDWQNHLIRK